MKRSVQHDGSTIVKDTIQQVRDSQVSQNLLMVMIFIGAVAVGWFGYRALFLASPPNVAVNETFQSDDLRVTLRIDELLVGDRSIEVQLNDSSGRAVDADAVRLRVSMVEMNMGNTLIEAERIGKGRYQLRGPLFTMGGNWTVEIMVERANQPTATVSKTFFVTLP